MKKYPTLDLFRVLCAGLVVVIHLGTSKETPIASMIVTCFSRQAVPFFFIVSGFFFANKIETVEDKKSFVLAYVSKKIGYFLWNMGIVAPSSNHCELFPIIRKSFLGLYCNGYYAQNFFGWSCTILVYSCAC